MINPVNPQEELELKLNDIKPYLPTLESEIRLLVKRINAKTPDKTIIQESIARVRRELDFMDDKLKQ